MKKDFKKEDDMGCKKGDLTQDFSKMVAGLESRNRTLWTQRMCQDASHFPTTNSMIKKLNDVSSHKVKADASFFSPGKKKAIRNSKENKKKRPGINMKQRKCGK